MENKLIRNSISAMLVAVMVMSVFSVVTLFGKDSAAAAGSKEKVDAIADTTSELSQALDMEKVEKSTYSTLGDKAVFYAANPDKNKIIPAKTMIAGKYSAVDFGGDGLSAAPVNGGTFFIPKKYTLKSGKSTFWESWGTSVDYLNANKIMFGMKFKLSPAGTWKITVDYDKKKWVLKEDSYGPYWTYEAADSKTYSATKTMKVKGTVKFNTNKGKLKASKKSKYIAQKGKVGTLPKPTRKGYKFKGWYTKKKGGKKISKSTKVNFLKTKKGTAVTYYAQWKKK